MPALARSVPFCALLLAFVLTLAACDTVTHDGAEPASTSTNTLSKAAAKSDVCHYDADANTYHLINVADPGLPAHRDHGDATPGEAVPTMNGFTFDAACQPLRNVEAGISCPAQLNVGEDGTFTGSTNPDAAGPLSFAFDFENDGVEDATGSIEETHTFAAAGTYTVEFTVAGPVNTDSATCSVTVIEPEPAICPCESIYTEAKNVWEAQEGRSWNPNFIGGSTCFESVTEAPGFGATDIFLVAEAFGSQGAGCYANVRKDRRPQGGQVEQTYTGLIVWTDRASEYPACQAFLADLCQP